MKILKKILKKKILKKKKKKKKKRALWKGEREWKCGFYNYKGGVLITVFG